MVVAKWNKSNALQSSLLSFIHNVVEGYALAVLILFRHNFQINIFFNVH